MSSYLMHRRKAFQSGGGVSFERFYSESWTSGTSHEVAWTGGAPSSGALLIAMATTDDSTQATAADFTLIAGTNDGNMSITLWYKEYTSGGPYSFGSGNTRGCAMIWSFTKSSGSWVTTFTTAMESVSTPAAATTSDMSGGDALTAVSGDALVWSAGNDGPVTTSNEPVPPMTEDINAQAGAFSFYGAHQTGLGAGSVTRSITWSVSDEQAFASCVVRAE